MSIIAWIIFGGIAGWIATMITGTNARYGIGANILIGIAGAFVGGLIGSVMGLGGVNSFDFGSLFIAIGGASLLLWVINKFAHA